MVTRTALFVVMAAAPACGSTVDLQIDAEAGSDRTPITGDLIWSQTVFGPLQGYVGDLVWTEGGGMVATIPRFEKNLGDRAPTMAAHEPDGALRWSVSDGGFFGVLAATGGGGVVVARSYEGLDGASAPAGLDWFDGDGGLTASWRLPATDATDALQMVNAAVAMPDGGVLWAGVTADGVAVAGRLDAAGPLMWMVPVELAGNTSYFTQPADVAVTADGGIVILVGLFGPFAPEGEPGVERHAVHVVRLEADGSEVWRVVLDGSAQRDLELAPSGNLVVSGVFQSWMTAGDFRLESDDPNDVQPFVAEIAPDGQVLRATELEVPASTSISPETYVDSATLSGDRVIVAGRYFTFDATDLPSGAWVAEYDLDGAALGEMLLPMSKGDPATGPRVLDVEPTGRLAIGGSFAGSMDFGDGEVSSGKGFPMKPFIAVYDLSPTDVD